MSVMESNAWNIEVFHRHSSDEKWTQGSRGHKGMLAGVGEAGGMGMEKGINVKGLCAGHRRWPGGLGSPVLTQK